jgi:hypothetical protein
MDGKLYKPLRGKEKENGNSRKIEEGDSKKRGHKSSDSGRRALVSGLSTGPHGSPPSRRSPIPGNPCWEKGQGGGGDRISGGNEPRTERLGKFSHNQNFIFLGD